MGKVVSVEAVEAPAPLPTELLLLLLLLLQEHVGIILSALIQLRAFSSKDTEWGLSTQNFCLTRFFEKREKEIEH